MKIKLMLLLLVGFAKIGFAQNLNMVIQVNDKLVTSEITGVYLNFQNQDGTISKNLVGYRPGELVLKPEDWKDINSESTKKITLSFNYYPVDLNHRYKHKFSVEIQKQDFERPSLILNVYNLTIKKFKKRYGCLTDESYITELVYPNSELLKPCK